MDKRTDTATQILRLLITFRNEFMKPIIQQVTPELSLQQIHVLVNIRDYEPVTMTSLSKEMCISKQQLTRLVDIMVSQGLAQRISDPQDRRIIRIGITEAGIAVLDGIENEFRERLANRLHSFDDQTLTELRATAIQLTKLIKALS